MAIERIDEQSFALPWSPNSPAITPTSWTPANPHAASRGDFATELKEMKTERPYTPVSVGTLARWPQRCVVCVQKDDTLVVEDVPVQGVKALKAIPTGKVKKECKDGTADKIVFEGNPFGTPTQAARNLLLIVAEFYRLGYGLLSGVRCRFGVSDQIVMQRTSHPYPHTSDLPKIWGVRMRGSDVWAIDSPAEYYECLRASLRHTGPGAVAQEREHGTTKHISMRHSMNDLTHHGNATHKPYRHIATIASAFCQSLGKAMDMGWRIVGSVSAYAETSDVLMFANESVAACSGRASRAGSGPVVGVSFFPSDDKLRLLILNANEDIVGHLSEYMKEHWGANIEQMMEDENYVSLWWTNKGSTIFSNNTQPKKHNSSHMMLDVFAHMLNSGFVFLERVRTSPIWGDVMLFQQQSENSDGQTTSQCQYFGVVRKGSDTVDIVRPLQANDAVAQAIQQTLKTHWTPGLKDVVPPSADTGAVHSFKCRGHPWSGREGSSLFSLFACHPSPSIKLTLALLDAVVCTGATFCADVTCGWICDGDMWIFRA